MPLRSILLYSFQKPSNLTGFDSFLSTRSFGVGGDIVEISSRIDYALRMLSEVAKAEEGSVVSVRYVAEQRGIPYSFARTIQHDLVKCGLLATARGPHGGMRLAVDARTTTLLDVIERVEGPVFQPNERSGMAQLDCLWEQLRHQTERYLSSVTIYQFAVEGLVPLPYDENMFRLAVPPTTTEVNS